MKKVIFTLNVNNYAPEIRAITRPYLEAYAKKIGATIYDITERKFPDFPPVYEKFQIYELAKEMQNDWNIYIDSDALIHPETIDFTLYLPKDTVGNNKNDMANIRFKYDDYFIRDGRNIGCGNWLAIASNLCIDLWKPLDDLTLEEAVANIQPTNGEKNLGMEASHLIDDYVTSRNIAKYGLKYKNVITLLEEVKLSDSEFFLHGYAMSEPAKVIMLQQTLERWKLK